MKNFIFELNKYSPLILALITLIYVLLTYQMLKINKKTINAIKEQNESHFRPYIQIRTYVRNHAIYLLIKNIGKSIANNVKFVIDQDIFQHGKPERNIREFPLFKEGVETIPPDQEYHIVLAIYTLFFKDENNKKLPVKFQITCSYSFFNKTVKEKHIIDIKSYQKTADITDEIVEQLKELNKNIKDINSQSN